MGGLVYLSTPTGDRVSVSADPAALEACKDAMRGSISAMQERLCDAARNIARLEQFPQLPEREVCRRCPFRRPCGRM